MLKAISLAVILLILPISSNAHKKNGEYHFVIKRGDTLSKYFNKLGLSHKLLVDLISANSDNKKLNNLTIGNKLTIKIDKNGDFDYLSYELNNNKTINIFKNNPSANKDWGKGRVKGSKIVIKNSLYADGKNKVDKKILDEVTKALSWDLDFGADLHKGDKFYIASKDNRLEAVIYVGKSKRIEAFHFEGAYYDRYGNSLSKSFLRAPLKYKRISSGFQLRRYHPILKTYRPHRAVDYAADYGTKVVSTADGIVSFKGRKGPLGKAVMIKHGPDYETVYAHLSKYARGIKKSKKVKRGQVIGYVGSTGRSTGPHLHYELRYKGKRKNPLTYKLPKSSKITKDKLWSFRAKVNSILSIL